MQKIRAEAERIDALFQAKQDDPKSEALSSIWDNTADFTAKSQALSKAARGSVGTLDEVKETMAEIGATCSACHKAYRK